jgi:hypothetical protein
MNQNYDAKLNRCNNLPVSQNRFGVSICQKKGLNFLETL